MSYHIVIRRFQGSLEFKPVVHNVGAETLSRCCKINLRGRRMITMRGRTKKYIAVDRSVLPLETFKIYLNKSVTERKFILSLVELLTANGKEEISAHFFFSKCS